jgi:DNA repair protein RadC
MPKRPHGPHFARELIVQYRTHPAKVLVDSKQIATAADAAAVVVPILRPQVQELFLALHLDAKRRLLGIQEVARGGLTDIQVSLRMILMAAVGEKNSCAIICAHNHPSGIPEPSRADIDMTNHFQTLMALFELELVDHIIVGAESYVSFRETGRMRRNY